MSGPDLLLGMRTGDARRRRQGCGDEEDAAEFVNLNHHKEVPMTLPPSRQPFLDLANEDRLSERETVAFTKLTLPVVRRNHPALELAKSPVSRKMRRSKKLRAILRVVVGFRQEESSTWRTLFLTM